MAIDRVIDSKARSQAEENFTISLRPKRLDECVGQSNVREKISIAITAASQRSEPLEHILFYSPFSRIYKELLNPHKILKGI